MNNIWIDYEKAVNWVGVCNVCGDLLLLQEAHCNRQGELLAWSCMRQLQTPGSHWPQCPGGTSATTCTCYDPSGRPGAVRYCHGKFYRAKRMKVALAAYRLGGRPALEALLGERVESLKPTKTPRG